MRSPWIPIPCASREPRAASREPRKDNLRLYMSTDPGGFRTLKVYRSLDGPHLRFFLHDMGHGWVKPATSAIEKSLYVYIYIYNEFSFCMFHIECVTCIVQLFFCNRMILKSHEPPGFLCPFYGAMVQEETRVVEGSQGSWQSFFMAR